MRSREVRKRLAAILLAFAVAFTMMPAAAGNLDSNAATAYWKKLKAKATSETSVKLSWKALTAVQKNKISGIAVYRAGQVIKKLSKTTKTFNDSSLAAGSTHSYQLKTYKKTTKKVKMYWNKKTGQWQTKKISGAKTKTVKKKKYKYANNSKIMKVTARTGGNAAEKVQITDYRGNVRTVKKNSADYNNPLYNREIDGTFTNEWGYELIQRHGLTFYPNKTGTVKYSIHVLNAPDNKLTIEIDRPESLVTKWGKDLYSPTSEQVPFIFGDHGRRLASVERISGTGKIRLATKSSNLPKISAYYAQINLWQIAGAWIDTGAVNLVAKYDGEVIDRYTLIINGNADSNGLDVYPASLYKIGVDAVAFFDNGGSLTEQGMWPLSQEEYQALKTEMGDYYAHMKAIESYVNKNYTYDQYTCWGGAFILKYYSILAHGIYGDSCQNDPSNPDHLSFRPDYACESGDYDLCFQTNGHHGSDCNCPNCK